MDAYEKIMDKQRLTVRLKGNDRVFTVAPLLLIGDMSTTLSSPWSKIAKVEGIVINGRIKKRMEDAELRDWCKEVEEITR